MYAFTIYLLCEKHFNVNAFLKSNVFSKLLRNIIIINADDDLHIRFWVRLKCKNKMRVISAKKRFDLELHTPNAGHFGSVSSFEDGSNTGKGCFGPVSRLGFVSVTPIAGNGSCHGILVAGRAYCFRLVCLSICLSVYVRLLTFER